MKFFSIPIVYAHCDIPCGIYDVQVSQLAAHTVIRMTDFLGQIKRDDETKAEHDVARVTHIKEEHARIIETELGTLQNDYFKEEHYKEHPELAELISKTTKQSVKVRQNIDKVAADELLEMVMQIAEIYYKTKGLEPKRVSSGYPTGGEIVTHL